MNLETIVQALQLRVKSGRDRLGVEVRGGYVGDLLSDVMANSREGDLWITRQIHQNIVAVASLKELAGIIISNGRAPEGDTVEKAEREGVAVMVSGLTSFELAGRTHELLSKQD